MIQQIKQWYAVYTAPRAEKKVSDRFKQIEIEHYLPLQKVKRNWSDRVKEVELPVINGYIFVCIGSTEFLKVTDVYGALSFVREGGQPVVIPNEQIETLRFMTANAPEPIEYCAENLEKGELISIVKGPLEGMIGELVEVKGKHKVMIRLHHFGCATTTIPLSFIQKK